MSSEPRHPAPASDHPDVVRIRRAVNRLGFAMWGVALVMLDIAVVATVDYHARDRTALKAAMSVLGYGGHDHAQPFTLRIELGDGHRVFSLRGGGEPYWPDDYPPTPERVETALVHMLALNIRPDGSGILTPFHQVTRYACDVQSPTMQPLSDDQILRFREIFCDWLATNSQWASPGTARYAAELKKGDREVTRIVWPLLLHDFFVLSVLGWSAWMLARTPLPTLLRFRHLNRRISHGFCPFCAYDLLSDFSRGCPECGWGREP